jgi:hypothetical protein
MSTLLAEMGSLVVFALAGHKLILLTFTSPGSNTQPKNGILSLWCYFPKSKPGLTLRKTSEKS